MTVEEIYLKLKDELGAENDISSSPERIFIKNDEHTICTLGMNRSHEIIFVEFKPAPKDLTDIGKESFVHPHPVEMLHDAGWRQAQITTWEEAEKLVDIINRSYKKRKKSSAEEAEGASRQAKIAAMKRRHAERVAKVTGKRAASDEKKAKAAALPAKSVEKQPAKAAKAKPAPKPAPKVAARKAKPEKKAKPTVKAKAKATPAKKEKTAAKKDKKANKGKKKK